MRLNEALKIAKKRGNHIQKKDLAALLWPKSSPVTQAVNMSNLCSGRTKNITPEQVKIICAATGVSADFLLGI